MRASEEQWYTETLCRPDSDIGSLLTWWGQQRQRQQVCSDGHKGASFFCRSDHRRQIAHHAAAARVLQDHAERGLVSGGQTLGQISDDYLDAEDLGAATQHRERLREALLINDDHIGLVVLVRPPHQQHGLDHSGGLIQERGARQRKSGEVLDECLEGQQCFESSLRDFRLVGRVGGVPGR